MMTANDIHSAIGTICKSSSRAKISEISGSIIRTKPGRLFPGPKTMPDAVVGEPRRRENQNHHVVIPGVRGRQESRDRQRCRFDLERTPLTPQSGDRDGGGNYRDALDQVRDQRARTEQPHHRENSRHRRPGRDLRLHPLALQNQPIEEGDPDVGAEQDRARRCQGKCGCSGRNEDPPVSSGNQGWGQQDSELRLAAQDSQKDARAYGEPLDQHESPDQQRRSVIAVLAKKDVDEGSGRADRGESRRFPPDQPRQGPGKER